jgi:hypothetical protein
MAHMNELDFVRAQLGKDREKMPAIDRKTIARAVFPHYARNKFAAVGFAHQQILLKVTPASSLHLALGLHPWPERLTSSERTSVNCLNPCTFRLPAETGAHVSPASVSQACVNVDARCVDPATSACQV